MCIFVWVINFTMRNGNLLSKYFGAFVSVYGIRIIGFRRFRAGGSVRSTLAGQMQHSMRALIHLRLLLGLAFTERYKYSVI